MSIIYSDSSLVITPKFVNLEGVTYVLSEVTTVRTGQLSGKFLDNIGGIVGAFILSILSGGIVGALISRNTFREPNPVSFIVPMIVVFGILVLMNMLTARRFGLVVRMSCGREGMLVSEDTAYLDKVRASLEQAIALNA